MGSSGSGPSTSTSRRTSTSTSTRTRTRTRGRRARARGARPRCDRRRRSFARGVWTAGVPPAPSGLEGVRETERSGGEYEYENEYENEGGEHEHGGHARAASNAAGRSREACGPRASRPPRLAWKGCVRSSPRSMPAVLGIAPVRPVARRPGRSAPNDRHPHQCCVVGGFPALTIAAAGSPRATVEVVSGVARRVLHQMPEGSLQGGLSCNAAR